MRTFFADQPLAPGPFRLEGPEFDHLAKVNRLGAGDEAWLIDGLGGRAFARIEAVDKTHASLRLENLTVESPPAARTEIAAPLPKGKRARQLVEKATELGAQAFHFIRFRRSHSTQPGEQKLQGLESQARAALKQSGRLHLPVFHPAGDVDALLNRSLPAQRCLLKPGASCSLLEWVERKGPGGTIVAVGPEGGFEKKEEELLEAAGFRPAALSTAVLRIETACLAALAVIEAASLPPSP